MPVQITIIGLGKIGASIGLALAKHKQTVYRVGHDLDISFERAAVKKDAIDKGEHNLPTAVKDARLVVLALPIHQIRKTLEYIAPDLMDGTVVVDTAPVKTEVAKWAKQILPDGTYYIGLVPTLGPEFFRDGQTGSDSARHDLFSKSIFLVDAPAGAPEEAVQLASDFTRLLGATAMITEIAESDGLVASTNLLPQLLAAALLETTIDQPGWKDKRKTAGYPFAAVASALDKDSESAGTLALHNVENTTRAIDAVIAALQSIKDDLKNADEKSILARIKASKDGRENWINEREFAEWIEMKGDPADYPSVAERLFGSVMGRRVKK